MEIEMVQLADMVAYERNAKIHTEEQIEKIAASIREYGARVPVLLDQNNVIIAGHGRKLAAMKLGLKALPAIRVTDLTEAQIRAYRVLDNTLAESGWDHEFLKIEFGKLFDAGFCNELTGFDESEIKALYEEEQIPGDNKILDEEELSKTKHECPECGGKW